MATRSGGVGCAGVGCLALLCCLVVGLIFALPAGGGLLLLASWHSTAAPGTITEAAAEAVRTGALRAAGLGAALLALLAVFAVCGTLVAALWVRRSVFGGSFLSRLLGLGVVCLLLPAAVRSAVTAPVSLAFSLLSELPGRLAAVAPLVGSGSSGALYGVDPARWFEMVSATTASTLFRSLDSFLSALRPADLILALALWALVGQLLPALGWEEEGAAEVPPSSPLARYLAALPRPRREGLLFAGILACGLYLSLAAIVAIPWLQAAKPSEGAATGEALRKVLETDLISTRELDERYSPDLLTQSAGAKRLQAWTQTPGASLVCAGGAPAPAEFVAAWDDRNTALAAVFPAWDKRRQDLAAQWQQYRQRVVSRQQELLQQSVDALQGQPAMCSEERAVYTQDLLSVFRDRSSSLRSSLQTTRGFVMWYCEAYEDWVKQTLASVDADASALAAYRPEARGTAPAVSRVLDPPDVQLPPEGVFDLPSGLEGQPRPPEPGLGWGLFGWVARWLLRTRSLPLALITGTLGFGLLGAAISSFVRERGAARVPRREGAEVAPPGDSPAVPSYGDLTAVVVRGVSAALVAFLAVKGGLAVFAGAGEEPNPYVLFFTCLVGSVFSEDVWRRAHEALLNLAKDKGGAPGAGGGQGAPAGDDATPPAASSRTDDTPTGNVHEDEDGEDGG